MMSLGSSRELVSVVAVRCRASNRAEKGRILDEFVGNTGYSRKYATQLLNHPPPRSAAKARKRIRRRRYDVTAQRNPTLPWVLCGS